MAADAMFREFFRAESVRAAVRGSSKTMERNAV